MTDPRTPTAPRLPDDLPAAAESVHSDATLGGGYVDIDLRGDAFEFTELAECSVGAGNWSESRWRRCMLADCVISESDLGNVAMSDSGWQRVAVTRSRLTGLDVSGCTLENISLSGCAVDLSNWRFTKVRRAVFDDCKLSGADFASAVLRDVRFVGCDLTGGEFREVTLERVRFDRCTLDGIGGVTNLAGATIEPADLVGLSYQLAAALGITIDDGSDDVL